MKKIYFLLLLFYFFNGLNAQIINFPDANFKAKLLEADVNNGIAYDFAIPLKIDTNGDGEIEVSEVLKITKLVINSSGISSLSGIENFTNLFVLNCSSNNLTNLDLSKLSQLINLDCSYNVLTSLNIIGLKNLEQIYCPKNELTELNLNGIPNLYSLNCDLNKLTNLNISELIKLKYLSLNYNQLTSINLIGLNQLDVISCQSNQLASIDLTGLNKLTALSCGWNKITELNLLEKTELSLLDCRTNNLTNLDLSGQTKLESIYCDANKLASLDVNSNLDLYGLTCSYNELSNLDLTNLVNLLNIDCSNNKLTSLDIKQNINLTELDCSSNILTNLDLNGLSLLWYLVFYDNQITSIDLTGLSELTNLSFFNNKIATIDFSSCPKIIDIDGGKNPIEAIDLSKLKDLETLWLGDTSINSLDLSNSDKLKGVNISNCPNLASINLKNGSTEDLNYLEPELLDYYKIDCSNFSNCPNLKYICADEGELESINQKISSYNYANCLVGGYCSFNLGGTNYTIQGNNRLDNNKNGCDASDLPAANVKFTISDGIETGTIISNNSGNYSIKVKEGTYNITPILENANYFTISPTSQNVTFPTDVSPFIQDFCITPIDTHKDLEITLIPLEVARPGFDTKYKLVYKNKGNVAQSGTVNLAFDDAVLDTVISNPVVSSQNTNNLSWNFSNLQPFEVREVTFTLNVNGPMETPAVNSGAILHYTATINSANTDENPNDNIFIFSHTVVGSLDPNDKTCLEGDVITPSLIGEFVHYLIRFENTGNYAAQNIVVKDIIDLTKFDISTLIPTDASHSYITKISEGNKVEFIFENINLPFEDTNNDGYIAFKIKTKSTLVVGDSFENTANIFFDYNFPVETNTAKTTYKTTLGKSDFEFSNYFSIYPNPANEVLNISAKKDIEIQSIAVYDILGQLIIALPNIKDTSKIDVSNLRTGNYFLKIKSDKGSSSIKFIKN